MTDCEYVIMDCNKKNIKYTVMDVVNDMAVNFDWLITILKHEGIKSKRVLVFCQSRKQCTELYSLFKEELGPLSYHVTNESTIRDDRSCVFAMYHLTTLPEQKLTVECSFRNPDGIIRVLFCTSSFGMGVDVKGCNLCIHYGPPGTTDEYLQQSGRIGRDSSPSNAIILKYKRCYNGTQIAKEMKEFCESKICRRKIILDSINNETLNIEIKHCCCDICSLNCRCLCVCQSIHGSCTCMITCHSSNVVGSIAETSIKISTEKYKQDHRTNRLPTYTVTETEREIFKMSLLDYQKSLLNETERSQLLVHADLATGFSTMLIYDLTDNMEFIGDLPSLIQNFPFFNEKHAQTVLGILESISPELSNTNESLSESYESSSNSDQEMSDNEFSESPSRPCILFSDSESE